MKACIAGVVCTDWSLSAGECWEGGSLARFLQLATVARPLLWTARSAGCGGVMLGLEFGLRGASSAAILGRLVLPLPHSRSSAVLANASSAEGPVCSDGGVGSLGGDGARSADPRTKLSARCSVIPYP